LQSLAVAQQAQEAAAQATAQAQAHAQSRWRAGLVSRFELLAAERADLTSRQRLLQTQAARVQATVLLVRALGGGW
jgi:outer membrane protein TolC